MAYPLRKRRKRATRPESKVFEMCRMTYQQSKLSRFGTMTKMTRAEALDGGAEGVRTPDLLNAIQALYQLSYDPIQSGENLGARPSIVKTIPAEKSSLIQSQNF